eukprot:41294-Chlamydomonas_euryale.AAC.2
MSRRSMQVASAGRTKISPLPPFSSPSVAASSSILDALALKSRPLPPPPPLACMRAGVGYERGRLRDEAVAREPADRRVGCTRWRAVRHRLCRWHVLPVGPYDRPDQARADGAHDA